MTTPAPPVLELPAMLFGLPGIVRRKVREASEKWTQEYLQTGTFAQPRRMRPVESGELLVMESGVVFDANPCARWRVYLLASASMGLDTGLSWEERQRMDERFESFCLSTPWGTLYQTARPSLPRSAESLTSRFAAMLRFWELFQGLRYACGPLDIHPSIEDLMDWLYRKTLEAWRPQGPVSVREHMALAVERMSHATRQERVDAVLRMIPVVLEMGPRLKHHEVLRDPDFLRERLAALSPEDFERICSVSLYSVSTQLAAWSRELDRQ